MTKSEKIGFMIMAVFLMCCIYFIGMIWYKSHSRTPEINLKPQHFIEIYGSVDVSIKSITFSTLYFSHNPKCRYYASFIEGADADSSKVFYYLAENKKGYYDLRIPLDVAQRGSCIWKLDGISAAVNPNNKKILSNDSGVGIIGFDTESNLKLNNLYLDMNCRAGSSYVNGMTCWLGKTNFTTLPRRCCINK